MGRWGTNRHMGARSQHTQISFKPQKSCQVLWQTDMGDPVLVSNNKAGLDYPIIHRPPQLQAFAFESPLHPSYHYHSNPAASCSFPWVGSLPRPSPPTCSFPSVHKHSAHARASAWRAGTPWSHGRPRVWSLPGTECGGRPSQGPGFPRLHGPSTDVHNRDALSSLLPSQSYSSEDGPTTLRPRKPLNPGLRASLPPNPAGESRGPGVERTRGGGPVGPQARGWPGPGEAGSQLSPGAAGWLAPGGAMASNCPPCGPAPGGGETERPLLAPTGVGGAPGAGRLQRRPYLLGKGPCPIALSVCTR